MSAHPRSIKVGKLRTLPVHKLECGKLQPRRVIDGVALGKLAESIRARGLLQPIFVRKAGRGKFEIVAGERRWHAAKIAGLTSVPTVVSNVSDEAALAIALVENLHREDLNPIDQAMAIRQLVNRFAMTHQEVAETIGKSRAAVTNLLRLLELPSEVQKMVVESKLDMGHARALLALPNGQRQHAAEYAAKERLSVRDIERIAKQAARKQAQASSSGGSFPIPDLTEWVRTNFGGSIELQEGTDGRWRLSFSFSDLEDLRVKTKALDGLAERIKDVFKD